METRVSEDYFFLILLHYNLVNIFDRNEGWDYKPNAITLKKSTGKYLLTYKIVSTKTINNDREHIQGPRDCTVFNQEPRIYQAWERELS
jgi:hypothetical protein